MGAMTRIDARMGAISERYDGEPHLSCMRRALCTTTESDTLLLPMLWKAG